MPDNENKELKLDAGFTEVVENNVVWNQYNDPEAFVKHSPVDKETIKELQKYEKGFNTAFVKECIENAKEQFQDGKDQVNYKGQNGIDSNSSIKVNVVKEHTFTVGFGDKKNEVTAPKVSVSITRKGIQNKAQINKAKQELGEFIKSLK